MSEFKPLNQKDTEKLQADLAEAVAKRGEAEDALKVAEAKLSEETERARALQEQVEVEQRNLHAAQTAAAEQLSEVNQLREQLKSNDRPGKPAKPKTLLVVSATDYNYDLGDGNKATPDKPVKAERYPGNLLDGLMTAGLVIEYEG